VAARLTVESAKLENSARRAAKFAQKAKISRHIGVGATDRYWRAAHVAINRSVRSLKVFSIAKKIKLVGAGAAAALIGTGLSNALRPKDNKKREALRAGAIGAGVFALQLAFLRGVGNKASPAILGALNKATRARMKKK
jgi:hypothetical protein